MIEQVGVKIWLLAGAKRKQSSPNLKLIPKLSRNCVCRMSLYRLSINNNKQKAPVYWPRNIMVVVGHPSLVFAYKGHGNGSDDNGTFKSHNGLAPMARAARI